MTDKRLLLGILAVLVWGVAARSPAEERRQSFDSEPGWDGYHHRPTVAVGQLVRQDFGFSPTRHARGAAAGELGGRITPAAEPAYVAKRLATKSLQDRLVASGTFLAEGRQFHVLLGFFHRETLNTWRAANTIALRLYGRGDVFYAYVEYATARWRADDHDGGRSQIRVALDELTHVPAAHPRQIRCQDHHTGPLCQQMQ